MNDFDEALPGPFEWDLKRLAASFECAGQANGFDDAERLSVQHATRLDVCARLRELARMGYLDIWYAHLSHDEVTTIWRGQETCQANLQKPVPQAPPRRLRARTGCERSRS